MTKNIDHLVLAKEDLAIAESADSKREAYKRAANHIAAAKKEGATNVVVATTIGKSEGEVRRLLKWKAEGFKADTPYLADTQATARAAKSHTRKVLREADPEELAEVIQDLPAPAVEKIARSPKVSKAATKVALESKSDDEVFDAGVAAEAELARRGKPLPKKPRKERTPSIELLKAVSGLKTLLIGLEDPDEAGPDERERYLMKGLVEAGHGFLDAIQTYVNDETKLTAADLESFNALLAEAASAE